MPSFDVVSEVDLHELNNAVDQANREVTTRFDFKDTGATFELADSEIRMKAQVEFQLQQMLDILQNKAGRRGIDIGSFDAGDVEETGPARRAVEDVVGRVTGKKRDDLQQVIAMLKDADLGLPLQYENFRD